MHVPSSALFSGRGLPEPRLGQHDVVNSTFVTQSDLPPRFYQDGDTITLPGPHSGTVHISGWDLLFTPGPLQKNELLSVDIPTHDPEVIAFFVNRERRPEFITNLFWVLRTIYDPFPPGQFHVTALPEPESPRSPCLPTNSIRRGLVRLNVAYNPDEHASENNVVQASYGICVSYYNYTAQQSDLSPLQFIVSEVALPTSQVLELQEMKSVFDRLFGPSRLFIPRALQPSRSLLATYHNGEYVPTFICETDDCGFVRIAASVFTTQIYQLEPSVVPFHEFSHFAFSHIPRERRKQFKRIQREIQQLQGNGSRSVYSIFTESTYLPATRINVGHPESDANELFASAANILRHFPEQFLRRYSRLPADQQEVAGCVVTSLLDTISEASDRAHSSPADMFPEFDMLRTEFQPPQ
jgi:hypothetical protein